MTEIVNVLGGAYVLIGANVLILDLGAWLEDALFYRHVRSCPDHESWVPRWSGGLLRAAVADAAHAALWPIGAVDAVATWWRGDR